MKVMQLSVKVLFILCDLYNVDFCLGTNPMGLQLFPNIALVWIRPEIPPISFLLQYHSFVLYFWSIRNFFVFWTWKLRFTRLSLNRANIFYFVCKENIFFLFCVDTVSNIRSLRARVRTILYPLDWDNTS